MVIPQLTKKQLRIGLAVLTVVLLATLWAITRFLSPSPPKAVVMTTGPADGAYHQFAKKYAASLLESGVTLVLKPSTGSAENLARMNADNAEVGLIQGGFGTLSNEPDREPDDIPLRSLGTVAFEPVWIFSRLDLNAGLASLAGKRIAVGAQGSGGRKVALDLLAHYGVTDVNATLLAEGGVGAASKLLAKEVDAFITVAATQSGAVQALIDQPAVRLASLAQAEGLTRRLPYLQTVTLRKGVVNPAAGIPAQDVVLLSTTANLVVREDLHPAIAFLLLEAAKPIHRGASLLNGVGDFPTTKGIDFPLSNEAQRYYKDGRPFLQRYMPFWLANFVTRLALVLVPLVAILVPLVKIVPELIDIRDRTRLYRRYGELMFLERDIQRGQLTQGELNACRDKLATIEQELAKTSFPIDFSDKLYTLRQHIEFVRSQLDGNPPTIRS